MSKIEIGMLVAIVALAGLLVAVGMYKAANFDCTQLTETKVAYSTSGNLIVIPGDEKCVRKAGR